MFLQATSQEIADWVDGILEGDPSLEITGLSGLREACPGDLSFMEHPRYAHLLASTKASLVLVSPEAKSDEKKSLIRVPQPSVAFGKIIDRIAPKPIAFSAGIDSTAKIHPSAKIDPTAIILPFAVIEEGATIGARTVIGSGCYVGHYVRIGSDDLFYPNVTVRERCVIGNRVIIHPGAVIGSDGFGYDFKNGQYVKVPQVGIVQLDDDVEIGANATLDRGRFGRTWLKRGVKIDNLVQIAHNVVIDEHSAVAAQTGISGSTLVGKYVRIGGQVGIVGHITVGDKATLGAQSGVNHEVAPGAFMFGYPALEHKEAMRTHAGVRRLPSLIEKVRELEKRLAELESYKSP